MAVILPIVGLTPGAVFLHEILDWRALAGSALIVLWVVLASLIQRSGKIAAAGARAGHLPPRLG